jgi:hypothetical protein
MRSDNSARGGRFGYVLAFAVGFSLVQFGCDSGADTKPESVGPDPQQIKRQHEMKSFMEKEGKNIKAKTSKN